MAKQLVTVQARLWAAAPHFSALLFGVGVFALHYALGAWLYGWRGTVYSILLTLSPLIGAWLVLLVRRSSGRDEWSRVLTPYAVWAALGILFVVAPRLVGGSDRVIPRSTTSQIVIANGLLLGRFLLAVVVPLLVPLLRMIVWFMNPPLKTADAAA